MYSLLRSNAMKKEDQYYVFRHFALENDKVPLLWEGLPSFCSGGLDSSLMAAVFKSRQLYTVGFKDGESEVEWAKIVAKHIGANLTVVWATEKNYKAVMETLIRNKKAPLHPNEPCLYLAAVQAKKDGYEEILNGEGADDLFGGYTDLIKNEKKYLKSKKAFLKRYAYIYKDIPDEVWHDIKEIGMREFLLKYHTPGLLLRANNACKCAGIQANFPYFLFHAWARKEIDFNKTILKKIAKAYLPKKIIEREKVGFPVPIDKWFGSYKKFADLNLKIWRSIKED